MGIKFVFMMLLLRDGFCSHLCLLAGDTNSEPILKMNKKHVKMFEARFCLILLYGFYPVAKKKDEEKVATIKSNSLDTVEKYL